MMVFLILGLVLAFASDSLTYSRYVWFYYDRIPHPELQYIFNITFSTIAPFWDVHLVTPETVTQYIQPSSLPMGFWSFNPIKQADYLRIALLHEYGGWYFDFSTLITSSQFLETHYSRLRSTNVSFFAFGSPSNHIIISLNAIYAPKGSQIVKRWFDEIHNLYSCGRLNYMYSALRANVGLNGNVFTKYPYMWTYFYVNVAFQVAIQRKVPRDCLLEVYPSEKGQYALLTKVNWDPRKYAEAFRLELKQRQYPISKLAGIHRRYLWPNLKNPREHDDPEYHPLKVGLTIDSSIIRRARISELFLSALVFSFLLNLFRVGKEQIYIL